MHKCIHAKQKMNGSFSDYSTIESGVPHGSVLGPLSNKPNIKIFADDTILYSVVCDPFQSANNLNHDLEVI